MSRGEKQGLARVSRGWQGFTLSHPCLPFLTLLFLLILAYPYSPLLTPVFTNTTDESPRAMWVWDARIVTQPQATSDLLRFCHRHGITTLYLSAYNLQPPYENAYRGFNRQAHREGLTVYALAGDPRWGQTRYHSVPLKWVESVCQLNSKASPQERFDGIHTDVEVYLLSKSWAERPAELLGGYLDLNVKIAEMIRNLPKPKNADPNFKPLLFGVDVPFWFDDDSSYRILWHGRVKLPTQHVLDTVDTITVMAYRNFAEGSDGTIQLVSLELNYADELGKKVVIGQETQEDLFPAYVTFGGTSCAQMRRELEKIQKAVGHRPSFGGFAFHHYESYRKLCGD